MTLRILLADDDAGIRFGVGDFLRTRGYTVEEAESVRETEEAFRADPPDLAILDYQLSDGSAVDLLPKLKLCAPDVPILILTGHGSIDLAVRAIKLGAEQFITKPVELPALEMIVARSLENQRARRRSAAGRSRAPRDPDPFLGTSPAIHTLEIQARRLAAADAPVLVIGETGAGKGVLARWLHRQGPRADEPFVDLNCAGLAPELLESELFGHEKGAFTGAVATKPGLLEVAHRGTVFLDEIGDVPSTVQPKLLKVLEEKRFRRLGAVDDRRVDIRLIAATHHDLVAMVSEDRFRRDLYYRIAGLPLLVPPLRERREDVPRLAERLLQEFGAEMGRAPATLDAGAVAALTAHPWPGNIRELRNVLERALLLGDGPVLGQRDLLLADAAPAPVTTDTRLTLEQLERQHIANVLGEEHGNVDRASHRLGIPRSTLYQKLKRYEIPRSRSK